MRIAIGSDHAGVALKDELKTQLAQEPSPSVPGGFTFEDVGTDSAASVDYPDFAAKVAAAVVAGRADRGILVCGTGIGMSMSANKVDGIRCSLCFDPYTARMAREHNDANVLALGARVTGPGLALEIARTWLSTAFAGGRHQRRVDKIMALEKPALKKLEQLE